ncbi:MAG TPA: copper amine oxidase N-terminal domain-containing protein, partial [Bacillota bacterium]|nr:copper amine oxidase N-terminal domain-containing protein [Bacillota bacterium]
MARRIVTSIVFLVVLIAGSMVNAQVGVELNGVEVSFPDQQPMIIAGRTLVPVRFVSEALGAAVIWYEQTSSVTVELADKVIVLSLGSRMVSVNNAHLLLDVPAQAVGGRTMVPLRFVSEMLGARVQWDESRNTVVILSVPTEVGNSGNIADADDTLD